MADRMAIIGAGQAGAWVAKTLRAEGYRGSIFLIGAERHPPYERPPLSKSILLGEPAAGCILLTPGQLAELNIDAVFGDEVVAIDRSARRVVCASGRDIGYDRLFLTTGSHPRVPNWLRPGQTTRSHLLRTIDDAERLKEGLGRTRHLIIVGGGWIGLEVASTAWTLGIGVTIVEAAPRVCLRSSPPVFAGWLEDLHRRHDVDFVFGHAVVRHDELDEAVSLTLDDGRSLVGDRLLVCIGGVPTTALAEGAGLAIDNGILVDATGRSSDPDIYAAGDVASFPCAFAGAVTRRESWANAQNQAIASARAALGATVDYADLPWLWSDQYGRNIQIAGRPEHAAVTLFQGSPSLECGCWLGLDGQGRPIGAIGVDAPKIFRPIMRMLRDGKDMDLQGWRQIGQSGEP